EGYMECLSLQSNWLPRCHSQLVYWDGCCGPQEATVRGLTQLHAQHLGDTCRFILTHACVYCTAWLMGEKQSR
ncbi:hypothetical protein KUCAC02_024241, partial [Chaenocephalus aceratus]